MREDLFEDVCYPDRVSCGASSQSFSCPHCKIISFVNQNTDRKIKPRKSRRGNYFSQFVRKFSLGNGPPDWVQEYVVTKESGKMLGTLVALSIARMPNLVRYTIVLGLIASSWKSTSGIFHMGYAYGYIARYLDCVSLLG